MRMQVLMASISMAKVPSMQVEMNALRKFAVLNYVAVVKAVKKRNRHLRKACGVGATPLAAVELLTQQPFFTSTKLARLSTQADVLAEVDGHPTVLMRKQLLHQPLVAPLHKMFMARALHCLMHWVLTYHCMTGPCRC